MFAVVKIAGQQYKVEKDQTLYVPHLGGNPGDKVEFAEISLVDADGKLVASAVFAALRPIFQRLRGDRKYGELVVILSERLLELSTERRSEFVKLGLINYVDELLAGGV